MLGVKIVLQEIRSRPRLHDHPEMCSKCDGAAALHTDGKALQKEIGFALVSGDR